MGMEIDRYGYEVGIQTSSHKALKRMEQASATPQRRGNNDEMEGKGGMDMSGTIEWRYSAQCVRACSLAAFIAYPS